MTMPWAEEEDDYGLGAGSVVTAIDSGQQVPSMPRAWYASIARYRLLSIQEQQACARARDLGEKRSPVCTCCTSPLEALIQHNYRLIMDVAYKYRNNDTDLDIVDLWQYGVPGLMKAAAKWQWQRGTTFSTAAHWWIRQAIARAMVDFGHAVREPAYVVTERYRAKRTHQPYPERITPESLDKTISHNSRGALEDITLADIIPDPAPLPEDRMTDAEKRTELLRAIVKHCTRKEAQAIVMRFGLDQAKGGDMSLEAVGKAMKLSRERVRQLEMHALLKLRQYLDYDTGGNLRKRANVVRLHLQPVLSAHQAGVRGIKQKQRPAHTATNPTTDTVARESQPVSSHQRQTRKRAPSRVASAVEVLAMPATTDDTATRPVAASSAAKVSTNGRNASSQGKHTA